MCHVSELSDKYVKSVSEVVKLGDTVRVKVISSTITGRVKLSRKAVLKEEKEAADKKASRPKTVADHGAKEIRRCWYLALAIGLAAGAGLAVPVVLLLAKRTRSPVAPQRAPGPRRRAHGRGGHPDRGPRPRDP